MRRPQAGDIVLVGMAASVQFKEQIMFRVIRVQDWTTYDGWIWLDGFQLDDEGDAVKRRDIFVRLAGLRYLKEPGGRCNSGPRSKGR